MMEAARNHGIDAILVKSVYRFARNTAESLRYTRELTDMEVSVYFEKEGIDTSCFGSEFLLTIFAGFLHRKKVIPSQKTSSEAYGTDTGLEKCHGIPYIAIEKEA